MPEHELTSTDGADEATANGPERANDHITWNLVVDPDPAGGFRWAVWTDHDLWLPLPVSGHADSEEDANEIARKVAARCTEAVHVYMQAAGTSHIRFAQLNVFPDTPAGGGLAVGRLTLEGAAADDGRDRWSDLEALAVDWQTRGGRQALVAMDSRQEESGWRLRELFGCMGALGEQITLACAAARDLAAAIDAAESPRSELVRRAWAEHVMHWTMAAGHMFQNVLGRAIALDPTVRPHLVEEEDASFKTSRRRALGTDFPFESDRNHDWPTFNRRNASFARRAATKSSIPAVVSVGELIHRVVVDPRWVAMSSLRGEAFHRWRAQTAGVSTMTRRVTRIVGDDGLLPGGEVPDVRGPENSVRAVACAEEALALLGEALEEFDATLPDVMRLLTSTVMHPDGLLSSYGPTALVESSPGTGVMIMALRADRAYDFLRAVGGGRLAHSDSEA